MKVRVILLFILALAPFILGWRFPEERFYSSLPGGSWFLFFLTGLAWCCVYVNTLYNAGNLQRVKRLLWLSPLVLFAFAIPALWIWFVVGLWWGMTYGGSPP